MSSTPFNDKADNSVVYSSAVTGSYTAEIDAYRQGTELTLPQHYVVGIIKTRAGYFDNNHQIPQQEFGQLKKKISDDLVYDDMSNLTNDSFIKKTSLVSWKGLEDVIVSNPDIDGIIEPITFRNPTLFKSVYGKEDPHLTRGAAGNGNIDVFGRSDDIVNVYDIKEKFLSNYNFVDEQKTMGNIRLENDQNQWKSDTRRIISYDDSITKDGVRLTGSMDTDVQKALLSCSPRTDTYIRPNFTRSTNGFDD